MKRMCWVLWFVLCGSSGVSLADNWVIGLDADMSSVAKAGGIALQQGIELAIEEINARGGLLGKPVTLEIKDHRGNPARGIANLAALAANKNLLAVVGGVHSPVIIAELPLIHETPLVYLDPWAAATSIIDNGYEPNFVFRLSVRDAWAAEVILKEAKQDGCDSVTLLLERTGWGRSNEISMTEAAAKLGLPISAIEWFNWNSKLLTPQVEELANADVRCIALVANTPEGVDIVHTVANLPAAIRPAIYSHWGITGGAFTDKINVEELASVKIKYLQTISYQHPKTPQGEALKIRYEEKYGKHEGHNAFNGVAHAYDLVQLLALAVESAQSSEAQKVQAALEQIQQYDGVMKQYKSPFSSANHEALNASDYLMLKFNEAGFGVTQ